MISRYTRPEMGAIWTEENKFRAWLEVEIVTAEVLAERGEVPAEAARAIRQKARFDVKRIAEIEAEVKHDVVAFTTAVAENLGPESRSLHYGLTSNDVVDTAQGLLLKSASRLILEGLQKLGVVLRRRALEFKDTVMVGRTHGVHAEPITFGLKLANWHSENGRNIARMERAAEEMAVGKISGAVGTFAHIGPEVEEEICRRLGLRAAAISSQVIQRDRHAHYLSTLAVIAASLEKIALEIRGLQRTEVREAEEYFSAGQKGSSAMPHKRNPVTCEQICGLSRVVRANAQAALEDVALWHERDISHSSVERIILPDSTTLVDYLLARTTRIVDTLLVYPESMKKNLEMTRGLVFSGQLLLDLAAKGVLREEAYRWVQRTAMRAWEHGEDFRKLVASDPDISRTLSPAEIASAFDLKRQLRHVDAIFARVFGS
ncbi:MAG: adenylosuccinate lyase [Acidobacteria bacterium]|nr:adenylosuccinate lyase [Acidobacteriota bacterium]